MGLREERLVKDKKYYKDLFRRRAIDSLRKIPKARAKMEDKRLLARLYKQLDLHSLRRVLLYIPLNIEVDIRPLINKLRRSGVDVYVPFMEGKSFRAIKYRLPLKRKRFGIYEPKNSKQYRPRKIDIAIVPIIAIDPTMRRIGFGKGFYDRFFEKEQDNIEKIIFIQRHLCYAPIVLTDSYDVRGDEIIAGSELKCFIESDK